MTQSRNQSMNLTLYHRTTIAEARSIAKHGFVDHEWDFGLRDAQTGEEVTVPGVLLTDRPLGPEEGLDGDAVLEVTLDVPEEDLSPFELEGMLWDTRVWVAPSEWVAEHASVRIAAVDPRTSGFYDAHNSEPETPEFG